VVPEMLVTAAPEIPGIATHDFLRRQVNAAIHRLEDVCSDLRKSGCAFSSRFCFVYRFIFFTASEAK
jgi:hypothetical protein